MKQPKKRAVKSDPPDNQIKVGEHRAYCVHCGTRNIIRKQWRTMTCSSCGKKGPVEEKPAKPGSKKSDKPRKPARTDKAPKVGTGVSPSESGNRMIFNTLAAIGIMVFLAVLIKVFTL